MYSRKMRTTALALVALGAAGIAEAATLSPHGIVVIDRGNGFERVQGPLGVQAGDRVMVNDGHAVISCGGHGQGQLQPGRVYTIGGDPCAGMAMGPGAGGMAGGAGAAGGGMAGAAGGAAGSVAGAAGGAAAAGMSTIGLAAGGVAAAVGVAAAASSAASSNKDKKKSGSP